MTKRDAIDILRKESYKQGIEGFTGTAELIEDIAKLLETDSKPMPVKRCKNGDGVEQDVKEGTVKQWFQKINEELDEFKREILVWNSFGCVPTINSVSEQKIKEEAMDTITVIISMLEAMGIDEEQRDEAQRLVNEKNRQRGRL